MSRSTSKPVFWPCVPLLAALFSCSFVGVKRAPSDLAQGEAPECTSSFTLPLIDFGGAVISGSSAVILHGQASSEDDEPDGGSSGSFRAIAWTSTALAVLFIASGAYGSRQVSRCRGQQAGAGQVPEPGPNPNWQEESKPGAGMPGASCKTDADCGDVLVCGEPMMTCIEPPPPPSAPSEPSAPADAGAGESP